MESISKRRRIEANLLPPVSQQAMLDNPFFVFPEELQLWLIIIGNIKEKLTLFNLFTAIPEFHYLFYLNLTKFEFTQMSPRKSEYQPIAEYPKIPYSVDEDWCSFVFDLLNQKSLVKSSQLTGGKWIRRTVYHPAIQYYKKVDDIKTSQILETPKDVWSFYKAWKSSSPEKSVLPTLEFYLVRRVDYWNFLKYLKALNTLCLKFGGAMRTLNLTFDWQLDADEVLRICKLLRHTPQLRALVLDFQTRDVAPIINSIVFPSLPQLENLEIRSRIQHQDALLEYFLNEGYFFSGKMKKLRLVTTENKMECRIDFELDKKFDGKSLEELNNFLKTRKRKSIYFRPKACTIGKMFKVMSKQNRAAEKLIIENGSFTTGETEIDIFPVRPKVKYIKFNDDSFPGFQFLSAFPALEHLHIVCSTGNTNLGFIDSNMEAESLTWLLWHYLYKDEIPKELSIWREFSSLQSLVVESEGVFSKHFVRKNKNKSVVFRNNIELVELDYLQSQFNV